VTMLTVFGFLLVCLKAHFNLHRGDTRNLIRKICAYRGSGRTGLKKKVSYLLRAAYGLCPNFRQTDVVELSFLNHFIEHLRVMLNLILRVTSRRLEQIQLLRPTQGLEDVIDAPAKVLSAPVYI
jgi:hypothetical protein